MTAGREGEERTRARSASASRAMLVNAYEPEETRIALCRSGLLEEYYVERPSRETLVGNLYKGIVTNTHPALQAAFVNIGLPKNAFLHVTDVRGEGEGPPPPPGRRPPPRRGPRRPPRRIQNLLKIGQEVLVEVTRDAFGEKGASLTMEISLPGRFLVLTPLTHRVGVSKRITSETQRRELMAILQSLHPPRDLGFIIRTASSEMNKTDLKNDLDYLVRLWHAMDARARSTPAPTLLYQESDLVIRTIPDNFGREIDEVLVDEPATYQRIVEFFRITMPRYEDRVRLYTEPDPLFRRFGVEPQIGQIYARTVDLSSGGSIVIEHTEAMTTIDVNSGRLTRTGSPEETAYQTDLDAAAAIARQIRLRDLGGVIVVDFIDLRQERHRTALNRALHDALSADRSPLTVSRMPDTCLYQIIRQKVRPSPATLSTKPCPRCRGSGVVPTPESASLAVLRDCRALLPRPSVASIEARVAPDVAAYLGQAKGPQIAELESRYRKTVRLIALQDFLPEQYEIRAFGADGIPVEIR
jgi:ribonuclease E